MSPGAARASLGDTDRAIGKIRLAVTGWAPHLSTAFGEMPPIVVEYRLTPLACRFMGIIEEVQRIRTRSTRRQACHLVTHEGGRRRTERRRLAAPATTR